MKPYRIFDHTADLGVEIYGRTKKDLFTNAAFAVFDLMADLNTVEARETWPISVEGADSVDLLINYLREALDLFNGKKLLLKTFTIHEIEEGRLSGEGRGETYDPARHRLKREIKAATYHQAEVREGPKGWTARVIFDV
ncbi:MAG: archease [Methanoregulaceae archaeon]|nr:archease [Methanoregulaceae archaeon]